MDLFELIKVILGRWRLVVPILLVTLGLAYMVQTRTPSEYEANGFLVIESPELVDGGSSNPVVDPAQVALGIQLEGDAAGRNFTVVPLGGNNYTVQAAAPTAGQVEDDARAVVNAMSERIAMIQEEEEVPAGERVELRLVDAAIVAEEQPDGTFLASATVFLNDPMQSKTNPYLANSSTGRLLEVAFQGDAAQAEFAQQTDGEVAARVSQQARDAAPLIEVVTMGSPPEAVIDGFYVAQEIMAQDLQARQERANVLPSAMLTLAVLDAPLGVSDESPPVQRATAGVVVLGGLLALGAALGLEGMDRRRQQQKKYLENLVESGQAPSAAPVATTSTRGGATSTTPDPLPGDTNPRAPVVTPAQAAGLQRTDPHRTDPHPAPSVDPTPQAGSEGGPVPTSTPTPSSIVEPPPTTVAPAVPPHLPTSLNDPEPAHPVAEDRGGEANGSHRNHVLEEKFRRALADRSAPDGDDDKERRVADDRDWRQQLTDPAPRTGPPRFPAP